MDGDCAPRQIDMGAQRQIAVLRSEYQIDAAIGAAGIVPVCADDRKHLRGKRDPLFAARSEDRIALQGFPDGLAKLCTPAGIPLSSDRYLDLMMRPT